MVDLAKLAQMYAPSQAQGGGVTNADFYAALAAARGQNPQDARLQAAQLQAQQFQMQQAQQASQQSEIMKRLDAVIGDKPLDEQLAILTDVVGSQAANTIIANKVKTQKAMRELELVGQPDYQVVPVEGGYAAAVNKNNPDDIRIIDPREATSQQWTGDGADIDMQPLPELAGAPGRGMEPLPPAPPGLSPKGEEEWNKEQAKIRAEKMSSLPKAIEGAESAIKLIDDALEHKGFQGSVGMKNWAYLFGLLDEPFPGTEEVGFLSYLKQLQGKNFLNAYETLKGGGQITQVEGQKAEQAFARMATAQSEEDFTKALREYQGILRSGLERARKDAGKGSGLPEGVKQAPDGNYYRPDPNRPGKYQRWRP